MAQACNEKHPSIPGLACRLPAKHASAHLATLEWSAAAARSAALAPISHEDVTPTEPRVAVEARKRWKLFP